MRGYSRFYSAMMKMQKLGRQDFLSGKPITAFPDASKRGSIAGKFPDRSRASYEIGWRAAKDESESQ